MESIKLTLIGILAAIVLVGGGIAIWQLGWFVEEKNAEKRAEIQNENSGTQENRRDKVLNYMRDVDLLGQESPAGRSAINNACDLIPRLSDTFQTDEIESFESLYC